MNTQDSLTKLDNIMSRLVLQRGAGIQYLSFMEDITNNTLRWDKYKNSYGGNVINMAIVSVEISLILFCNRLWDNHKDTQSIINAVKILTEESEKVISRRSNDVDATFTPDWKNKQHKFIDKISNRCNRLYSCEVRKVLRVIRSENLAHLVSDSRDRAKNFPQGFEHHTVKRKHLIKFAKLSVELIDKIELARNGTVYDTKGTIKIFQSYCDYFWNSMPVLQDEEQKNSTQ